MPESTIFTVGHSTQTVEELVRILTTRGITLLVDVRTVPRSRHNPQFDRDALPAALASAGIRYLHLKELGGLRHPRRDSPNTGWRNASFRGYADYMETPEFAAALAGLMEMAERDTLAIMCAEAVPWRCHRSLIADALAVRGVRVEHLLPDGHGKPHEVTRFAKVDGVVVRYPG